MTNYCKEFKAAKGYVKTGAFGGWAFCTEPETLNRFKDATKANNRDLFSDNVVKFLKDEGLDGLDFDWEYPRAPDIPGVPLGLVEETSDYLKFLKLVRTKLASGKEISVAIPASY